MLQFHDINNQKIAELTEDYPMIQTIANTMSFLGDCYYNDCIGVIIPKSILSDDFFDLKTGLAGEILQKFSNYRMKLAIIGDFSELKSKSLNDFIRESNRFKNINFVSSLDEAFGVLTN